MDWIERGLRRTNSLGAGRSVNNLMGRTDYILNTDGLDVVPPPRAGASTPFSLTPL
jgi:hypothetical protein